MQDITTVLSAESCGDRSHYSNIILFGMCPTCKHVFSLDNQPATGDETV